MSLIKDQTLYMTKEMESKVLYFLSKCKGKEWSGPAWYSVVTDEDGFPTNVTLEYFHTLHLGDASSTDWDGKELVKIYKNLRKKYPKIGKEWVQGNIHSHHSMGAFYSATDEQQCIDGTFPGMFYYSLVVSEKVGKEYHFGASYVDQFNRVHIDDNWDVECEQISIDNNEWKKEHSLIVKRKQKETPKTPSYFRKYINTDEGSQASLFNSRPLNIKEERERAQTKEDRYMDHVDALSYNNSFLPDAAFDPDLFDEFDNIQLDYEKGRITKKTFLNRLEKIGVDEYGIPILKK